MRETISDNSVATQRKKILSWLSHSPLTTLEARQHLDCMHPAARVMELRKRGFSIDTVWVNDLSLSGETHRVARYVLKAEEDIK